MSTKTRAEVLAEALENLEATGWGEDCFALAAHSEEQATLAAEELRRLSASEAALMEALELAASIIGHPDDSASQGFADLIARTKEPRNG